MNRPGSEPGGVGGRQSPFACAPPRAIAVRQSERVSESLRAQDCVQSRPPASSTVRPFLPPYCSARLPCRPSSTESCERRPNVPLKLPSTVRIRFVPTSGVFESTFAACLAGARSATSGVRRRTAYPTDTKRKHVSRCPKRKTLPRSNATACSRHCGPASKRTCAATLASNGPPYKQDSSRTVPNSGRSMKWSNLEVNRTLLISIPRQANSSLWIVQRRALRDAEASVTTAKR